MRRHRRPARWPTVLTLVVGTAACNDHPLLPLESSLSAGVRETLDFPRKAPVDFLFVIDDSGSMAEEQESLAQNFAALSGFLASGLGGRANVRIAVTDTDLDRPDRRGAFITPDDPSCEGFGPVLSLGDDATPTGRAVSPQSAAHALACLTRLGTRGGSREKGLEAMRLALSCDGPNAAHFGACCVPGPEGVPVYDRNCVDAPDFLRPDATLVVVFLTDEDDCSDPAANPARAVRPICRTGEPEAGDCAPGEGATACRARHCDISAQPIRALCRHGIEGADTRGIPAAYDDPEYCPGGDRAACFAAECGTLDAAACHAQFCGSTARPGDPDTNLRLNTCQWFPQRLTPVEDYSRFLVGLKRDPNRRLIVAAFTGAPKFTEAGATVRASLPLVATNPACEGAGASDDVRESCCPDGLCEGAPRSACTSAFGDAGAGLRYLALADAFGELGLGCRAADDPHCVSLCEGDLAGPLEALLTVVTDALAVTCLAGRPVPGTLRARLSCPDGTCGPAELSETAFSVQPNETCSSGRALHLGTSVPPGARLILSYERDLVRSGEP
jgi:hypothetical protein